MPLINGINTDGKHRVLVVLSGGQDSTTCLYAALASRAVIEGEESPQVFAIAYDYGQKHSVELTCASKIAEDAGVQLRIINLGFFGELVSSALLSHELDINADHSRLAGRPASFVPNRNALFLTLAHAYAQELGCQEVWTGVCETDYSGYPDCRHDFIQGLFAALNTGAEVDIRCVTPLMHLNKAQTFQLAEECEGLDAVILDSHTCYNGNHWALHTWGYGCNDCPACLLRAKGWAEYNASLPPEA